jgi:hypothetical protein
VRGGGGGDRAHAVGQTREDDTAVPPSTAVFEDGLFICLSWRQPGGGEVLEWLHSTGCPWSVTTACAEAGSGHLEVLRWLRERGCQWDTGTCAHAARSGHLRVLQWAREHGCPCNWLTPANAAFGGNVAVLQWAREQDCPWDMATCTCAAMGGHLEVLQWVRENDATGEVWNENDVRTHAFGPRKQEVLTWLDELGAP